MVKKKAIFFDRDGVLVKTKIIKKKPVAIKNKNEIKILRGIIPLCKKLEKKYLMFMVTNQPDVSKNKITKKNVKCINFFLKEKLNLKKTYTCYCNNDKCYNRKPNPGMLKKAIKKYNITPEKSFLIGDRWKDIVAGKRASCKTILLKKNYSNIKKCNPDYIINNIHQIKKILNI